VQVLVASRVEIQTRSAHVYRLQESLDQFLQNVPEESVTLNELRDDGDDLRSIAHEAELPPVVKLADIIMIEGIKSRASDVHIEPGIDAVAVRYRIDGVLEESFRFPKWVQNALIRPAEGDGEARHHRAPRPAGRPHPAALRRAPRRSPRLGVSRRSTAKRSRCASSMRRRA